MSSFCPLTLELTTQPVVTPCGHTYDRDALELRRKLGGDAASICAVCSAPLPNVGQEFYGLEVEAGARARAEASRAEQLALESALRDGTFVDASAVVVDESSLLGKGPYGVVRRGTWQGRNVAVKQVPVGAEGAATGLQAELAALHSLRHPHVVSLLGVVRAPQQLWLLLELAEHGTLASLLAGQPEARFLAFGAADALPGATRTFFRIGAQVACALGCLHRRHLVHANLKPTNVLICADGVAKLADFGASRAAHTPMVEASALAEGAGAAAYVAPEASAPGGRASAPSDIFALAILLSYCLTGERPYAALGANDGAITAAIQAGERPALPPSAPGGLRHLLARAWAPRAAERPSADSFQLELLAMSGSPHETRFRASSAPPLPGVEEAH